MSESEAKDILDRQVAWVARWQFGGEELARDRRESDKKVFLYSQKQAAYEWIWSEWQKWFKMNDGKAFWEEAVDEKLLVPPSKVPKPVDCKASLLDLRRVMGEQKSEGNFFWTWTLFAKDLNDL